MPAYPTATNSLQDFNTRHSSNYYKQYQGPAGQQQYRSTFQQPLGSEPPVHNSSSHHQQQQQQQQQQYVLRNQQQQAENQPAISLVGVANVTNSISNSNSADHNSKPEIPTSGSATFSVNQLVSNPTAGHYPHLQQQQQRNSTAKKSAGSGSSNSSKHQPSKQQQAKGGSEGKDKQPVDRGEEARKAVRATSALAGSSSGNNSRRNRSGNRSNYSAESLFGGSQSASITAVGTADSGGGGGSKMGSHPRMRTHPQQQVGGDLTLVLIKAAPTSLK